MLRSLIAMSLSPLPCLGQLSIPDMVTCGACSITVTDVIRLDDSPEAPMPGWPMLVELDGRGRYWLGYLNDLPLIYERTGSLFRELGPSGDGPDEYRYPNGVATLPGDSTLVWDRSRNNLYVLAPDTRRARAISFPRTSAAISLAVIRWPDSILIHSLRAANDPRHPFSIHDLGGTTAHTLHEFGAAFQESTGDRLRFGLPVLREIMRSDQKALWTWSWMAESYRFEQWSLDGTRVSVIERRPGWWPDTDGRLRSVSPGIRTALQDSTGLIWVFLDEPTEIGMAAQKSPPGTPLASLLSNDPSRRANEKLYRTVIEVLDPIAGRVVARSTLGAWVFATLPGRRVAIYDTAAEVPFIRIVQLDMIVP